MHPETFHCYDYEEFITRANLVVVMQQAAVRHDDSHEGAPSWQDRQCKQQCLHAEKAVQDVRHSRQRLRKYTIMTTVTECSADCCALSFAHFAA